MPPAVSFWALKESFAERWLHALSWHDRWRNWREDRAEIKAEQEAMRAEEAERTEMRPSLFGGLFRHRERGSETDPLDEVPAYQRARLAAEREKNQKFPLPPPRASPAFGSALQGNPCPAPCRFPAPSRATSCPCRPRALSRRNSRPPLRRAPWSNARRLRALSPPPQPPPRDAAEIAIHDRAEAGARTTTVAPKQVSGFKLPPSTLLTASEGPQTVREDALREEAKVLVEKCAEFDVRGQVVQINPGPMVTTYEFKPEAGVKYSRVTASPTISASPCAPKAF